MKTVLLLIAVALVAALVSGQNRCHAPSQMSFYETCWNCTDRGDQVLETNFRQYDAINERDYVFQEIFKGNVSLSAHRIILYHRDHVGFNFDVKAKTCTHFKTGDFRRIGVRPNATFESSFVVGGPGEEVIVERWSEKLPGKPLHWIGEFSLKTCYPIMQLFKMGYAHLLYYSDVVVGLEYPMRFVLPKECRKHLPITDTPVDPLLAKPLSFRSMHYY